MKPRSLILLLVASGCGLVAALATAQHLAGNNSQQPSIPGEPTRAVVVADTEIEAGIQLKAEMLRVVELPAKDLPDGTFAAVAELTGQTLRYPVFKGEPVLTGKLGRGLSALARELPEGMKACTVRVEGQDAQMTGLINPGDHVDVHWLTLKSDLASTSVRLLLQNIRVLAVGQRTDLDESDSIESKNSRGQSSENYTLLVQPIQNKRLLAAMSKGGKFRLTLRGKTDRTVEELDENSLDILLGLVPAPEGPTVVVTHPEATTEGDNYDIEYYKGNEISVETLTVSEGQRSASKK